MAHGLQITQGCLWIERIFLWVLVWTDEHLIALLSWLRVLEWAIIDQFLISCNEDLVFMRRSLLCRVGYIVIHCHILVVLGLTASFDSWFSHLPNVTQSISSGWFQLLGRQALKVTTVIVGRGFIVEIMSVVQICVIIWFWILRFKTNMLAWF